MELLDRIRELSKERGVTVAQVERGAGLTVTTIAKWNRITPGIDKVALVADFFGISIDELIGRTPPKISKSERMILDLLDQLNEDGQTAALKQMQFLSLQPEYIKSDIPGEKEAIIDAEA